MSLPEPTERIIAGWLLDQRPGTKATTMANYGRTARLAARHLDLLTCGPDEVAAAVGAGWSTEKGRQPAVRCLRRLFAWMVSHGLREDNPAPTHTGAAGFGPVRDEWVPPAWSAPVAGWVGWLVAAGRRPGTITDRRRSIIAFARANPAGPRRVGPQQIVDWFGAHPHWKPATRRRELCSLAGFWNWAVQFGQAFGDPTGALGVIRVPKGVPRPADDALFTGVLAAAGGPLRLMLLLGAHAGLRRSEIAAVRREDVTDHGLVVEGKAGKTRLIPLTAQLRGELLACPPGWIFPGRFGGHLCPGTVGKRLTEAMGGAATAHQLRHRFGTKAWRGTKDLLAVQTLMGHESPATTAIYIEVAGEDLVRAVEAAAA
jgi:integrase/recombinase XerC